MKKIKLFVTLLLINSLNAAELVVVKGDASNNFQESSFIKMMSILNNGKVPYPFSSLLDSFQTGVREEGNILMIPQGRSLVKEHADYHNPRIIVEPLSKGVHGDDQIMDIDGKVTQSPFIDKHEQWDKKREEFKQMGIFPSDIFIGFAPNHKALEVISYNPKKPGYDFFVVEDYEEGKTPKIVSNPALCLGCHQNEAPIFSRFPWTEFLGNTSKNTDTALIDRTNDIVKKIRSANPDRETIEGIFLEEKRFDLSAVAFFDSLVRVSNTNISDKISCESLCKKNDPLDCKQKLLLAALSGKNNYSDYPYFKEVLKRIEASSFKSSMIPNRDPDTNLGFKEIVTSEEAEAVLAERKKTDPNAVNEISERHGKKKIYDVTFDESVFGARIGTAEKDPRFVDPVSLRPLNSNILDLKNKINKAKSFNQKIAEVVDNCLPMEEISKAIPKDKISPALFSAPQVVASLRNWPDTRGLVNSLVKANMPDQRPHVKECTEKQRPVLPVYQYADLDKIVVKLKEEKIDKPQAMFQKYCSQCHGPEGFIKLPLTSLESMAQYRPTFSSMAPLERLQKNIMPPAFAKQPSKEERALMIKSLLELKH